MSNDVFVVVETSKVGETVLGVFSSIEKARAILPRHDTKRLEDYRVEFHVIDEPAEDEQAWTVMMSRDGNRFDVTPVVLCSCGDDHDALENSSYIEEGGSRMHCVVWAKSKGQALDAGDRYREWLIKEGAWTDKKMGIVPISAQGILDATEAVEV